MASVIVILQRGLILTTDNGTQESTKTQLPLQTEADAPVRCGAESLFWTKALTSELQSQK